MRSVQRISRNTKWICYFGCYATPILLAINWIFDGRFFSAVHFELYSFTLQVEKLTPTIQLLGFLVTMIPGSFFMLILYFAARLFREYQEHHFFEIKNARLIRNLGLTLLIYQGVRPLYDALISALLTQHTAHPDIMVVFDASNLREIILGLLFFVIGWVMAEAAQLKKENDFTI